MKDHTRCALAILAFASLASRSINADGTLYSAAVLSDQPLVYWHFDEADGNAVQQAPLSVRPPTTENDLAPTGTATRVSHAALASGLRLGNAAEFDGDGFFRAAATRTGRAVLDGAWAVELWFQSQDYNQSTYLVNFGPLHGDNSPAVIYNFSPNTEFLEIFAGAGGRTGTTGPMMSDQDWHHLVFVYYGDGLDGVSARTDAYLNGTQFPYLAGISKRLSPAAVIVGAALAGGEDAFAGRIDEVAVYDLSGLPDETAVENRVASMVAAHVASAQAAGGEAYANVVLADQPFLYWNFDEADGNARQLAPIALPAPDNARNDLLLAGSARRVEHASIASGLELGNAADLDGVSLFQAAGGLDTGIDVVRGPWVLECWFQFTGDQDNRYLLNMGRGANYGSPALVYGSFGPRLEVAGMGRSGASGVVVDDRNWHHLLVVNYNTAPGLVDPGTNSVNRVDFFLDNVQHPDVGGGFNQPIDFGDRLAFGAASPAGDGGVLGRLDELAIYHLNHLATVEAVEAKAAALAASHYAAAFGGGPTAIITITRHPAHATANLGQTVTFEVAATVTGATEPLKYQWLRNGVAMDGAESAIYATPPISLYDIGTNAYSARISAGSAFKISDPAHLIVAAPASPPPTPYAIEVANDHPVLYWNFDELTGPALQGMPVASKPVGADNDLAPVGFVQRMQHADMGSGLDALGGAIFLDGLSYMMNPSLRVGRTSLDGPWAVEFWIQMDGGFGMARDQYMANFGPAGADNAPAFIHGYTVDRLEVFAGASGRSSLDGPVLADNGWHHILWVNHDAAPSGADNRVDVFVDGTLYPDAGGTFNHPISLTRLLVGAATVTPVNGFTGVIDEFAVYDLSGLAADQIEAETARMAADRLSAAHAPGGPTYASVVLADQPILYYNFDEPEGDAQQLAPVSLPEPDPARNHLATAAAGRVQHSAVSSGLFLGNAADFDGKGHFGTPQIDAGRPSIAAPWAVEFWMQVQGPNENEREDYLMNFGGNAPAFIYDYNPDLLEIFAGSRTAGGPWVTDTLWHHVLWIFYGDGLAGVADRADAYLDGTAFPYVRNTFTRALSLSGPLLVGAAAPGSNGFQGRLDEIAVYDLAAVGDETAIQTWAEQLVARHRGTAVDTPAALVYTRSGAGITLSWTPPGFTLEQNDNVSDPAGWSAVPGGTASPVVLTIPSSGAKFYRLRK